jgi:hypothetical protein
MSERSYRADSIVVVQYIRIVQTGVRFPPGPPMIDTYLIMKL